MPPATTKRDLLSILDIAEELPALINRAKAMKAARRRGDFSRRLPGKTLAMIFEKPSTRTRTSFEVGMHDLGGHSLYLSPKDLQLGRGETIADTARVLSRYVDGIVYRAFHHADEEALARWATVPVINALDDREHPCQVAADLMTMSEQWHGRLRGHRLAYIGDGNNVCNSLLLGCALMGVHVTCAVPAAYRPPSEIVSEATRRARQAGAELAFTEEPREAARGAEALYTDVWVSMGDEAEQAARERAFAGFQLNEDLVRLASPQAFVMHDLPAHRGQEITDAVMDGPRAVVWDQAENRLHAQKAILELLLAKPPSAGRKARRRPT